jgi:hypothetical protein
MATVNISPVARQQFFDANGDPLSGGQLFTYTAGTTTKEATYTTSVGDVANANPIILDSNGYTPSGLWLVDGTSYKFVLAPSGDTDPPASAIWTEDNIDGVNDAPVVGNTQWVASGFTPTFVSGTSFTVTGDQTATLDVGRRLQFTVSAGTVYGHIDTSVFTTLTTVTLTMDAGDALDSGLSAFNISVLSGTNHGVPSLADAEWKLLGLPTLTTTNAFTNDNTHTGKIIMSGKAIDHAVHTEAAHATTCDIWAGGNEVVLSGSVVTFTDFPDAPQAGAVRWVKANDAHVITDGANIEVQGDQDYTCSANDILRVLAKTTTTFKVDIFKSTGSMVLGTMQASTSGTSIDFTSLPAGIKRITVMFDGVSTNGTSNLEVQIGDSGGLETSGYLSAACNCFASPDPATATTGFLLTGSIAAVTVLNGFITMTLMDEATNLWISSGNLGASDAAAVQVSGGSKNLSDVLTQLSVKAVNGTDTFDLGNINIMYEFKI